MMLNLLLLGLSFVLILGGAFTFTNSVEWAGARMGWGQGAVGSVLAAVATALPESVIPVVAIIAGAQGGPIAIGAIIGAPFLLSTLGMTLVGITALVLRNKRQNGDQLELHAASTKRDITVFLVLLSTALVLGLIGNRILNIAAAVLFAVVYAIYVWRAVARGGEASGEGELGGLLFDPDKSTPPRNVRIGAQVVVSLALIIGGAELFVTEVEAVSHRWGVTGLVLALVLAPLASELPEKLNSVLWVRRGKDSLALGNITGAMVFQSSIPVAVGLLFVNWSMGAASIAAVLAALLGGVLCLVTVSRHSRFTLPHVLAWLLLYAAAVGFIFAQ